MRLTLLLYFHFWLLFQGFSQNPYYSSVIEEPGIQLFVALHVEKDTIYEFGRDVLATGEHIPHMRKILPNGQLLTKNEYLGVSFPTKNWTGYVDQMDGYIYMGSYELDNSTGSNLYKATFTKFNMAGDTIFRIVDTSFISSYTDIVCEPQKGTITTTSAVADITDTLYDVFVTQFDSLGNINWSVRFGNPNNHDQAYSIDTTGDGGYVVAGYQYNNPTTLAYRYVIKLDSLGNVIWEHKSGSNGYQAANVLVLSPEIYLVYGHDSPNSNEDSYISFMDSSGNVLWDTTFTDFDWDGVLETDIVFKVQQVNDGFVFIGSGRRPNYAYAAPFLLKVGLNGNYLWHRWYLPRMASAYFNDIAMLSDSSFVIAGYVFPENASQSQDAWLLRLNCSGYDTVPYPNFRITNDTAVALPQTLTFENHSRYADSYLWEFGDGTTYFHASNPADTLSSEPFIAHTYQQPGQYTVTLHAIACKDTTSYEKTYTIEPGQIQDGELLSVYPNPAQEQLNIWLHNADIDQQYQMLVLDAAGRLVMEKSLIGSVLNTGFTFDVSNRESGVYILRVGGQSKRFVISP